MSVSKLTGRTQPDSVLNTYAIPDVQVQVVWEAIALHTTASVPIRKFLAAGIGRIRTFESIRTLASHCFLVWLMVPKSAPAFVHTVADFGTTTLAFRNICIRKRVLLNSGVLLDVLGIAFDQFPAEAREEIVARYPRVNFKQGFIEEYFAGFAHKPATTYGTVNAGFCERFIPGYKSPNACDLIAASPFPDSASRSSPS